MGRFIALALLSIVSFTLPVFADDAINPMIWSRDQWRSDLFGGYAHTDNDWRTRIHRQLRIETRVALDSTVTEEFDQFVLARRARLILVGEANRRALTVSRAPGTARRCDGMLVLTWTGERALSRCHHRTNPKRVLGP